MNGIQSLAAPAEHATVALPRRLWIEYIDNRTISDRDLMVLIFLERCYWARRL